MDNLFEPAAEDHGAITDMAHLDERVVDDDEEYVSDDIASDLGEEHGPELLDSMELRKMELEVNADLEKNMEKEHTSERIVADVDRPDTEDVQLIAPHEPTVEELVAASTVSKTTGHFACSIEPWKSFSRVGRITTYPYPKPMEQRSVAMMCSTQKGKCSVTRGGKQ